MSADNWAVCPRCKCRHERAAVARREEADAAYGKVPVEDWKAKDAEALLAAGPFSQTTFREDYEVGVTESGSFYVDYNGRCTQCGLYQSFKHESEVDGVSL